MTQLSPSVSNKENDISYTPPKLNNEIAAYVGFFEKGPINQPVFITNINDFKVTFGRGIDLFLNDWYQVYNYLEYASGIWVCRVDATGNSNANNLNINNIKIETDEDIQNYTFTNSVNIIAKTPGESGNLLSIAIINYNDYMNNVIIKNNVNAKNVFSFFEVGYYGLCVFRNDVLMETFYFNDNKIDSNYIYCNFSNNIQSYYNDTIIKLSNGFTELPSKMSLQDSYDLFSNKDYYDIDIIIGNELDNNLAISIAESRRDCIAFIGLPTFYGKILNVNLGTDEARVLYTHAGNPILINKHKQSKKYNQNDYKHLDEYLKTLQYSEFCHFTLNIKEQYDGFTNKIQLINIAGDTAGLKAQASVNTPWAPGAGLEKGIIKNLKSTYINFDQSIYNTYYKFGINFVQNNILASQKTYYNKESNFNRINIRSLFNHIEKSIYSIARNNLFNENTSSLRRNMAVSIKSILSDAQAKNGINNAKIHVYTSENNNEIIIDVQIQPVYIAEYIMVRFTNVGTNIIFDVMQNSKGE